MIIHTSLITLYLFSVLAQSPQHCWDFANQSGDIPDGCGSIPLELNSNFNLL